MAPMACTPPALNIRLTPAVPAATSMAGFIFPLRSGGVHSTISLHPAILAGVASMSTVLNSGAVPPGMYRPTRSIGTLLCQQLTPGIVSVFTPSKRCALWKARMFSYASRMALFSSSPTLCHASAISPSVTARLLRLTWSNFSSYSATARSPRSLTSASTCATVALRAVMSAMGRLTISAHWSAAGYLTILIFFSISSSRWE